MLLVNVMLGASFKIHWGSSYESMIISFTKLILSESTAPKIDSLKYQMLCLGLQDRVVFSPSWKCRRVWEQPPIHSDDWSSYSLRLVWNPPHRTLAWNRKSCRFCLSSKCSLVRVSALSSEVQWMSRWDRSVCSKRNQTRSSWRLFSRGLRLLCPIPTERAQAWS